MNSRLRAIALLVTAVWTVPLIQVQGAAATDESTTASCSAASQEYQQMLGVYEASPRKDGKSYRLLVEAFKNANRERKNCMQAINAEFKSDLQAIKTRFEQAKANSNLRREVRETQRRSEISAASLKRDEAIRTLPLIPELPARPVRSN